MDFYFDCFKKEKLLQTKDNLVLNSFPLQLKSKYKINDLSDAYVLLLFILK